MSKHSHHMTGALLGELKLCTEVGPSLGDTRIHLLEAIDRLGSLTQAAKSIPLSYRAAWDALDEMNNLAEQPLVIRTTGGNSMMYRGFDVYCVGYPCAAAPAINLWAQSLRYVLARWNLRSH